MRLTTRQTGIISYAGLDESALWAGAKRAFAQADEPVPERFRAFLPIFPVELIQNMSYAGHKEHNLAKVSPAGFSTDPGEYHRLLCAEIPDLYTGENHLRNFDAEDRFRGGGAVVVDRAWATLFPQYQPFLGERLVIYMIGGGHQAVAVPESVFPRGGGVLEGAERELRVTARCAHYTAYLKTRLQMGEKYDPARFEEDYLRLNELSSVCVRQKELGRVMQDLCIIRGLSDAPPDNEGLYTLNAKRAEGVKQYVPWRYACDTFEPAPITRGTARLLQLCYEDGGFLGDLWLPYQDASEYIDRQRMTLDVRALCEGFQIAPAYDPATRGGRYPSHARVVVVRDRELRPMVADALNNPAYGSGMNPLGMLNKLVFLPDSRELLRQNRLALESVSLACENTAVDADTYRRMRGLARWQEWKGRLVDALYRRESALSQMQVGSRAYARANELLTKRVEAIEREVKNAAVSPPGGQLSGYDADIDYLRRMRQNREGVLDGDREPVFFAPDALRELCIESGYAMRTAVRSFALRDLLTEPPPEEAGRSPGEAGPAEDTAVREGSPLKNGPAGPADVVPEAAGGDASGETAPVPQPAALPKDASAVQAPTGAKTSVADGTSSKPKKYKKAQMSASPRFEQIDMFVAAAADSGDGVAETKPVPAGGHLQPARYVVRSLSQLTGGNASAGPGKMARLLEKNKRTNDDPDGRP